MGDLIQISHLMYGGNPTQPVEFGWRLCVNHSAGVYTRRWSGGELLHVSKSQIEKVLDYEPEMELEISPGEVDI